VRRFAVMKSEKERKKKVQPGWLSQRVVRRLLLLGGCCFAGFDFGSGVGVLLGEALDAAGGVNQLLLAGERKGGNWSRFRRSACRP